MKLPCQGSSPNDEGCPLGAPDLVSAGWQRRFDVPMARRNEVIALYRQLGFEVKEVPVAIEAVPTECQGCLQGSDLVTIYTRRREQ